MLQGIILVLLIFMTSVLMIDDDEDDLDLFHEAVLALDPKTEWKQSMDPKNVLSELKQRNSARPDVIVLDLYMQQMSGLEFLSELKKIERLSNIPVVVFTGSEFLEDSRACLSLGAASVIHKPSDWSEFLETAKVILSNTNDE